MKESVDPGRQTETVLDFMLRIAPDVTRYSLHDLDLKIRAAVAAEPGEIKRLVADHNAMLCLELATHLAARYAQLHDSTHQPKAQDAPASGLENPPDPAAGI